MRKKLNAVATTKYDIIELIDIIFNEVDDLREIAELAMRPCIKVQIADLGYIILSNLPIFRSDIRRWIYRNPAK